MMRKFFLLILISVGSSVLIYAARIDTLTVLSTVMNKKINNLVITPDDYSEKGTSYSVIYLLHGAGGNYASWVKGIPSIIDFSDMYNIIMVFPDGGLTSWYFDSPVDQNMQYETFVSSELVTSVDKSYNTITDKKGRAITGLSMGGHGAFYLSFKHLDIWGASGSMSGGLDLLPFTSKWDIDKRLGSFEENKANWENNSVINMINLLEGKSIKLIFDCGVDDFFYEVNKKMHEKLLASKIPHDYIERPGGHTKKYWENSLKYQMVFFMQYFNSQTD